MKTPEQSQIWIHYKTWFQTMVAFRVLTPYGANSVIHLHQIHSPCKRRGYVRAWRRNKIHQTVWKATTHRIRTLFQYFIPNCSSHFQVNTMCAETSKTLNTQRVWTRKTEVTQTWFINDAFFNINEWPIWKHVSLCSEQKNDFKPLV